MRSAERGNGASCYGDVSSGGHDVRIVLLLLRKVTELEESHSHSRSSKL